MQGELVPFVRIVADTQTDTAVVGIVIEGPATNPVVAFTSSPELPEEEVLAQLLFGQNLQTLSPLQALQMANAVATLAGRGGEGIVGRLRRGFGLDNLDVKTDADGTASLTAGKYLTEKVYSEVTVDQVGKSQINLNLDISKDIKLRARTGSDGESGVGVFLEKDY
jgi:translocation and assembly module TamB